MGTAQTIVPLIKIKFAIVAAGLGAGLGMIWAALMANRITLTERVTEEALLVVLGGSVGLALGWLMGPHGTKQRICSRIQPIPTHYRPAALAPSSLVVPPVRLGPALAPA